MTDYIQSLREATLKFCDGKPAEQKARAMNLIEAIIEGDMTTDQIVAAIETDSLPVRYVAPPAISS